jgi:hypothetical protein
VPDLAPLVLASATRHQLGWPHDRINVRAYVCARCGVSERTLRRWIATGHLHADKQGGAFLVSIEEVRTLAGERRTHAADTAAAPDMSAAPNIEVSNIVDTPAADTLQHSQDLVSLVAQLHAEVSATKDEAREYATAAALWQERARVLTDQLALAAPEPPVEAQPAPQPAMVVKTRRICLSGTACVRWRSA